MKKIILLTALISISFIVKAQSLYIMQANGQAKYVQSTMPKVDTTGIYSDLLSIPGSTTPTSVSGSTSGSAQFQVVANQANYKKILIHTTSLTGTATFTFPSTFANTPGIFASSLLSAVVITSLSTTSVTISGTNMTGYIIIEGW